MHSLCPFGTPNFSVPNQQSPRSSQGVLKCCGDLSWSKRPPAVRWRRWIGWGEIRVAVSLCWFQVLEPSNTLQKGLSWSGGCPWSWAQHSRAALGRMLSACAWWAPVPGERLCPRFWELNQQADVRVPSLSATSTHCGVERDPVFVICSPQCLHTTGSQCLASEYM